MSPRPPPPLPPVRGFGNGYIEIHKMEGNDFPFASRTENVTIPTHGTGHRRETENEILDWEGI